MRESGYYPPGTEFDPNAPWNQEEPEPRVHKVKVTIFYSEEMEVEIENYSEDVDLCDVSYYAKEHAKKKYPSLDLEDYEYEVLD